MAGDDHAAAVTVRDFGVGLGPGEATLVFNRFWRADPARARTSGGTGLGLADLAARTPTCTAAGCRPGAGPARAPSSGCTLPRGRRRHLAPQPAAAGARRRQEPVT